MTNVMIRAGKQAFAVSDRLRHDRETVVKLCVGDNRQCLHHSSLI